MSLITYLQEKQSWIRCNSTLMLFQTTLIMFILSILLMLIEMLVYKTSLERFDLIFWVAAGIPAYFLTIPLTMYLAKLYVGHEVDRESLAKREEERGGVSKKSYWRLFAINAAWIGLLTMDAVFMPFTSAGQNITADASKDAILIALICFVVSFSQAKKGWKDSK